MTAKEHEIRAAERKIMAKIRRVKLRKSRELAAMTTEEFVEHNRKLAQELKAKGFNVVPSIR